MTDRRINKTKRAIFAALNELLSEKKFAHITVNDIIDRSDIGRATFYAHFLSKDDLLFNYVQTIFKSFNEDVTKHFSENDKGKLIPVAELFEHIQHNENKIKGLLSSESGALLLKKFKSDWGEKLKPALLRHLQSGQNSTIPIDLLINHIISTLIELIQFWLNDYMRYSPEQMEEYYYALILPSITAALEE